jgi:aspartate racemase
MEFMSNKPILGIIGGAGVAATNKFNELLEVKLTRKGAFRDCHHPIVISYQATTVPSRSMFLESKGESFVPGYIEVGKQLKSAGATVLCMTCNTAHYAINEIQKNIDLPFINLVEEVVKTVKKQGLLKVGIIASSGSIKGKVYDKYFHTLFPEAQVIYPESCIQKDVTKGIINIKNKYRFSEKNNPKRPNFLFKKICYHLKDKGANIIISGCTDIRVDFSPDDFTDIKIIDSLEVLLEVVCDKFYFKF